VHEIERHRESLLIVGHQGVLRMILAYFQGVPREEAPHLSLALNHVIKINTTDTTHNLFILFFFSGSGALADTNRNHWRLSDYLTSCSSFSMNGSLPV